MIYKFTVRPNSRTAASSRPPIARTLGIDRVTLLRDYYVETRLPLQPDHVCALASFLGSPLSETVDVNEPLVPGAMVQVTYRRGIVDNENDSLLRVCALLGVDAIATKVASTFVGDCAELVPALRRFVVNPTIEDLHTEEPQYDTLLPRGRRLPMQVIDLRLMSDAGLAAVGRANGRNLSAAQMHAIRALQERLGLAHVSDVLLEALDARWSDHCFHTTWKALGDLLGLLTRAATATANPNIVSMFHDNAGVWRFYDGQCLVLKAETHNGPSAVSAYFGQLTKLGGVLRDVIGCGQGANPIGSFEYTATGLVTGNGACASRTPHTDGTVQPPLQTARETIRAIKEYGNTVGVAMMWSKMTFHPKYRAKPFALGGCLGLIPERYAHKGTPQPGDLVVLVGGLTGNDGLHGASSSSAGGSMDGAAVQIGAPLEEVKFREAVLEMRDADCIRAITDIGGAGLNSAAGEIGDPCGIWINTAAVPLKVAGLATWQILLSESQERMLIAVPPGRWTQSASILDRHGVRNTVIGKFTGTGRYTVVHDETLGEDGIRACDHHDMPLAGEVAFDVPYDAIGTCPLPNLPLIPPTTAGSVAQWPQIAPRDIPPLLTKLLADPEVADQTYAASQYDSSVQGLTCYGPYMGKAHRVPTSYWASTPLYGKSFAAVFSTAFDPWLFEAHPTRAARQCTLAAVHSQVLAGVSRLDICLCDNFYTPHLDPHGFFWLTEMVKELAQLSTALGTPFISGKDSSAGSSSTPSGIVSVPPSVFVSALGKVPDRTRLVPNEWQRAGNLLVRIGPDCSSLGGTLTARRLGIESNHVDLVDVEEFLAYLDGLASLRTGVIRSAVPIGAGGILVRTVLNAFGSALGADLDIPLGGCHELLQEHRCGALAEVHPDDFHDLPAALRPKVVGRVSEREFSVRLGGLDILQEEQLTTWATSFERLLA